MSDWGWIPPRQRPPWWQSLLINLGFGVFLLSLFYGVAWLISAAA